MTQGALDVAAATPREPELTVLVPGRTYEGRGPAHDTKLGPPQRCTVVAVLEHGYRTEGPRQVAPFIAFGAERHWREVAPDA